MINSLTVQDFRGIHALSIPTLNRINLIVGDNNCGKTSILEAILLLRNPSDLSNLYKIAKLRDAAVFHGDRLPKEHGRCDTSVMIAVL
jgi:predicted ATP-dependent endonuclease of OLD family